MAELEEAIKKNPQPVLDLGQRVGAPRRVGIGVDSGRLALLLAVLEGAGVSLSAREVFVSCTGGIEVTEPSADLAIVAALVSSARGKPLPDESRHAV